MERQNIKGLILTGKQRKITQASVSLQHLIQSSKDTVLMLNTSTILPKYRHILKKYISVITLSDQDKVRYEYRPDLLCYRMYGTVEMVPFILAINGMVSKMEFANFDNGLKVYSKNVKDILNEIILREKDRIRANRASLNKELS